MRSTAHRREPPQFVAAMAWVALASFAAGFGGFLLFGMNTLG